MKKKLLVIGASALLLLGAASAGLISANRSVKETKADALTISNLDDFKAVFDKAATNNSRDIELLADLDISSYLGEVDGGGACGMAGTYTGTFDGNGHIIYGGNSSGGADHGILFHFVSGTVKNLILDWTHEGSAANGGLCYGPNGTFENVTIVTRANGGNTIGAFGRNSNGGTFTNCNVHFIVGSANTFSAISSVLADQTVSNCKYSVTTGDIAAQGFSKVTMQNINEQKSAVIGVPEQLGGFYGLPVTWTSSDSNVATVSGDTVTPVAAGTVTLTGTLTNSPVAYATQYGALTRTIELKISGAAPVTGVSIDDGDSSVMEGKTIKRTATLVGNEYTSIEWTSSNEDVATVSSNGTEVTITGVGEGTSTIEVAVKSENGTTYKASTNIMVTGATKMRVYFGIKNGFTNLGDKYSLYAHGGQVTDNLHFNLEDTGYQFTYGVDYADTHADYDCDLYYTDINLDAIGIDAAEEHFFVQLRNRGNAAWGAAGQLFYDNRESGYVLSLGTDWSGGSPVINLGTASDMDVVLDFCVDVMKSETIPLDNQGTTADCESNYNTAITEVAKLTDAQRLLFKGTQYYERLQKWAIANGTTFSINDQGQIGSSNQLTVSSVSKNNTAIIVIVSAVIAVTLCGAALLIRRKKEQ